MKKRGCQIACLVNLKVAVYEANSLTVKGVRQRYSVEPAQKKNTRKGAKRKVKLEMLCAQKSFISIVCGFFMKLRIISLVVEPRVGYMS